MIYILQMFDTMLCLLVKDKATKIIVFSLLIILAVLK